jgi:hypothetical protein
MINNFTKGRFCQGLEDIISLNLANKAKDYAYQAAHPDSRFGCTDGNRQTAEKIPLEDVFTNFGCYPRVCVSGRGPSREHGLGLDLA